MSDPEVEVDDVVEEEEMQETVVRRAALKFKRIPLDVSVAATALRIVLGWTFVYEAIWRLAAPGGYSLAGHFHLAAWLGAGFFQRVAGIDALTGLVDGFTVFLLLAAGFALMLGLRVRLASAWLAGYCALLYVLAPPFAVPTGESHFLLVNRSALFVAFLAALWFVPGFSVTDGIRALKMRKEWHRYEHHRNADGEWPQVPACATRRRVIAGLAAFPALALTGVGANWAWRSTRRPTIGFTGPFVPPVTTADLAELTRPVSERGKIRGVELSRLILGGNVIGGWAHTRDMGNVYDKLVKAYHVDERVFRTFQLAERCGIKAILTNPSLMRVISRYWRECGGRLKFLSDSGGNCVKGARDSVEHGASMVYAHGGVSDSRAAKGDWKFFREYLDESRKLGVPVGIGCHKLATVKFCVEHDCLPDFWMKTVHRTDYPTADFGDGANRFNHDNNFCIDGAEATFEYMKDRPEPWIGFKINAAGAYHPRESLPMAFKGGCDFVCLGMYDFQIVEDVNLFNAVFRNGKPKRERPWRA